MLSLYLLEIAWWLDVSKNDGRMVCGHSQGGRNSKPVTVLASGYRLSVFCAKSCLAQSGVIIFLLVSQFFKAPVSYAAVDEYVIVIPYWVFSYKEAKVAAGSVGSSFSISGSSGNPQFKRYQFSIGGRGASTATFKNIPSSSSDSGKVETFSHQGDGLYAVSAAYQVQLGTRESREVMLVLDGGLGLTSPLSQERRLFQDVRVAPSVMVREEPEDLNFAYQVSLAKKRSSERVGAAKTPPSYDIAMLGVDEENSAAIKKHWLTEIVISYIERLDLFQMVNAAGASSGGADDRPLIVKGVITSDQDCYLVFQRAKRTLTKQKNKMVVIEGQDDASSYITMDGNLLSSGLNVLCLQDEGGLFAIKQWTHDDGLIEHGYETQTQLTLGKKPNYTSPFYIAGWHKPKNIAAGDMFKLDFRVGQYAYWNIDLIPINEGEIIEEVSKKLREKQVEVEAKEMGKSTSAPSRQKKSRSLESAMKENSAQSAKFSASYPEASGQSASSGLTADFHELSLNMAEAAYDDFSHDSSEANSQLVLQHRLRSLVGHLVLHKKDNWYRDLKTPHDVRVVFGMAESAVGNFLECITQYKVNMKGETMYVKNNKKKGVQLMSIRDDMRRDLDESKDIELFEKLKSAHNRLEEIKARGFVSDYCDYCQGDEGNLQKLLRSVKPGSK